MDNCCHTGYQTIFDDKRAKKQLRRFKKKGLTGTTRRLVEGIRPRIHPGQSLLDIGGGIGGISLTLLKEGISEVKHVDISEAYIHTFRNELTARNQDGQVEIFPGDFVEMEEQIPETDWVTLDKVICCYPDYRQLVRHSAQKARKGYAYAIPRDVWWVRLINRLGQAYLKWTGTSFRSFVHPAEEIERQVTQLGFTRIRQEYMREWMCVVYERRS